MGFGATNIIWNGINFVIFIVLLYILIAKPIANAINKKQEKIINSISDVEDRLDEVEKNLEKGMTKLDDVKKDVEKIETNAQKTSERMKEDILKSAHEESEKIKIQLKKSIDLDINKSKIELRKDVIEKALEKSKDLIAKNLNDDLQVKIVESVIMSLNNDKTGN